MAATESQMLELGTVAPEFCLPAPDGGMHGLGEGKCAYLVMFICNHCPFVKHVREQLAKIGHDYLPQDISIVAINSNDVDSYPGDSPARMQEEANAWGYEFPYVFDAEQSVAKAYHAACTPDFFLFNADRKLVYRGQLDDSRPGNDVPVTGNDLRDALDAALSGKVVSAAQKPSIGCNIKWRPGNEPDIFG